MSDVIKAAVDTEAAIIKFRVRMLCALVLMAVLAGIGYGIWHHGFQAADSKWVTAHNKEVKALNDKIAGIEESSHTEAKKLRAQVTELQAKLEKIKAATPIIVAHDHTGAVLKCEGKEVVPYLGSDFTKAWNDLNEEGAMK